MKVTVKTYVEKIDVVNIVCDCCGNSVESRIVPVNWKSVSSYHSEWSGAYDDSYNDFDLCSAKCYVKMLKKHIEKYDGMNSAVFDDMMLSFAKELLSICE